MTGGGTTAGDEDIVAAVWIPLTPQDVPALEHLLRSADPFVASTIDTDDPYHLVDYLQHSIYGGAELAAVLDRNLVSRIVRLAEGRHVDHSRPESAVDRVYHIVIALFDSASGKRITDAQVTARVAELGLTKVPPFPVATRERVPFGPQKKLDSMLIAGTVTYGNYFTLPARGLYRVQVQVRGPSMPGVIETEFDFQGGR